MGVLMSAGRNARNQASIVNRPNAGGSKKGGLSQGISNFRSTTSGLSYNRGTNTQFGLTWTTGISFNPTQLRRGSYYASHSSVLG